MAFMHDPELADLRQRIRHSTAHVMADVVTRMFPEAKLAIGPPTDDGFYYDFLVSEPFSDDALEEIEQRMREVVGQDLPFEYSEYSREDSLAMNADEPLKLEIINEIPEDEAISTYRHGDFEDLCAGPHVESTGRIPAFKLLNVAGAYWRGDEHRPMLQRIYGTAFENQDALDDYLHRLEEARRRDHRTLGRELDLFSIHEETGPGLIVWHPKGARVRGVLEDFWKREHYKAGYGLVYTPHIGRSSLWETSGHLDFYKENMYAAMDMDGQDYYLKPMNCPFHIMYYRTALRSYRDLPMRIGRTRLRLSLRARRRAARPPARARPDAGRRAHLLPPGPGGVGDRRRARPHISAAKRAWVRGVRGHALDPPRKVGWNPPNAGRSPRSRSDERSTLSTCRSRLTKAAGPSTGQR